jgi:hypothetical protein
VLSQLGKGIAGTATPCSSVNPRMGSGGHWVPAGLGIGTVPALITIAASGYSAATSSSVPFVAHRSGHPIDNAHEDLCTGGEVEPDMIGEAGTEVPTDGKRDAGLF